MLRNRGTEFDLYSFWFWKQLSWMNTGSCSHLQCYLPPHFGRCGNALLSHCCLAKLSSLLGRTAECFQLPQPITTAASPKVAFGKVIRIRSRFKAMKTNTDASICSSLLITSILSAFRGEIVHANGREDGFYAAWQRTTFKTLLFSPLNGLNLLNKDVARKQEVEGK